MENDLFEWDDVKAARNWRNHSVTFEMACEAFKDMFAVEWVDRDHDNAEERFAMLAMVEHRVMFVSYTMRQHRIRIISARLAEPFERRRYHNENQA